MFYSCINSLSKILYKYILFRITQKQNDIALLFTKSINCMKRIITFGVMFLQKKRNWVKYIIYPFIQDFVEKMIFSFLKLWNQLTLFSYLN